MNAPKILYILECDHIMPAEMWATEVRCYNCDLKGPFKKITDIHVWEWVASCNSCKSRTWCGLAKPLAEYHANKHVQKRPEHKGFVLYMRNPYAVRILEKRLKNATFASGDKTPQST